MKNPWKIATTRNGVPLGGKGWTFRTRDAADEYLATLRQYDANNPLGHLIERKVEAA